METSSSYKILFSNKSIIQDPERNFRFYKKRIVDDLPQSQWMYNIFKDSMHSKIQAAGILGIIFVCISVYFYEFLITNYEIITPTLTTIN